jgi:large subunit ribosomal protein L46
LDRKLKESLFLIVKRNRGDYHWQFPQGRVLENEAALRTTAERVVDRAVGGGQAQVKRWFVSNVPSGHYCYGYPKEVQAARKQFGAKVYFYRAQYLSGSIKLETKLYKDYAWIARSELGEYFDKDTAAYLSEMLPIM